MCCKDNPSNLCNPAQSDTAAEVTVKDYPSLLGSEVQKPDKLIRPPD
jgi:hypothetical protein